MSSHDALFLGYSAIKSARYTSRDITQLVPATSVSVLKSNFSRDESVKMVYHKPNRSIQNSINKDVLSSNVVISGVDIINGKSNKSNFNKTNATELVKVEATSLH